MNVAKLISLLKAKNLTISTCESLTGGQLGSAFTSIEGVGEVYYGGFITYHNNAKTNVGLVPCEVITHYGAISAECAGFMADNTKLLFNTNVALSLTGNAGPLALEDKPLGLVYIGMVVDNEHETKECHFSGSRLEVQSQAVESALEMLFNHLSK